jgi:tRNA nucleotidyltransferase (CCA-adding enzyme)
MQHPNALAGLNHLVRCKLHHAVLPELESADWNRIEQLMQPRIAKEFPISLACILVSLTDAQAGLRAITNRWKLSNEETRITDAAVKHWSIIAQAANLPWSQVQPRLIDRDALAIWKLAATIVEAEGSDDSGIRLAKDALSWTSEALDPPALLSGDGLRELGIAAGPQYKTILQAIRDAQLDKQLETHEEAIELALKLANPK